MSYVLSESLVVRATLGTLRDASVRFLSVSDEIISVLPFKSNVDIKPTKSLGFGEASFKSATTTTSPALRRSVNALRNAIAGVFREIFLLKSRGRRPKTTPPPTHNG